MNYDRVYIIFFYFRSLIFCFRAKMFLISRSIVNLSFQRQFRCSSMHNKEVILHNIYDFKNSQKKIFFHLLLLSFSLNSLIKTDTSLN